MHQVQWAVWHLLRGVTGATVSCKKCGATTCDECIGKTLVADARCLTCAHGQEPEKDEAGVRAQAGKMIKDAFGRNADEIGDVPSALRIALFFSFRSIKHKSWAWRK